MLGKTPWAEAEAEAMAVGIDGQRAIKARLTYRIYKTEVAD